MGNLHFFRSLSFPLTQVRYKQSRHFSSSFSIAFLSSLFFVCLFEPVPTSIVLQPRDLSMSFCLIHTESICLLSNPFIYSHFPFSPSFLLRPSLSFSHMLPFLVNDVKIAAQLLSSQLILEGEICFLQRDTCTRRLRRDAPLQNLNCMSGAPAVQYERR